MNNFNRRSFLKSSSILAGATLVTPSLISCQNPNSKLNIAAIGSGGKGYDITHDWASGERVIALCDVHPDKSDVLNTRKKYPNANVYLDYREMLDNEKDLDAVTVSTPDHTHGIIASNAMNRGLHVYVQKPLTHNIEEARALTKIAAKNKVVTQMGNQAHTGTYSNQFREWVKNDVIKNVTEVDAWKGPSCFFMQKDKRINDWPKKEPKPEGMDWDLWLGPAEHHPFSRMYHTFEWRGFHPYGSGMLGDWGCHIIDMIHHYLDLGLPTEINAQRMDDHNKVIFPLNSHMEFKFPARGKHPGLKLNWKDGVNCQASIPKKYWDNPVKAPRLGGAGTLFKVGGEDYMIQRNSHGGSSRLIPYEKSKDLDLKTENIREDHSESFIQACLGNGKTWSPFSVGGLLTQVLTLGCIAQYYNRNIKFDPKTKQITNDNLANARLSIKPRQGWEEFYKIA